MQVNEVESFKGKKIKKKVILLQHVAHMGENASKSFTGKHEGIWPLEKPSRICEDGIKTYPKEVGCEGLAGFICFRMRSSTGEFLY